MKDGLLQNILFSLNKNKITVYQINILEKESKEFFFIRRFLDMNRAKYTKSYTVTVFRDFYEENNLYRGSSTIKIDNSMDIDEIDYKVKQAYKLASYIKNIFYELPSFNKEILQNDKLITEKDIYRFIDSLYEEDRYDDVFINSVEVCFINFSERVINSNGIDVSYSMSEINGEIITQCKNPQDVEVCENYSYFWVDTESISKNIQIQLKYTRDRAKAKSNYLCGKYNVIIDGKNVRTLFNYYYMRSHANYIYLKYSDFQIGQLVSSTSSQLKNINLFSRTPFSSEGLKMKDLILIQNGILINIHGDCRYCHYIGVNPTGSYNAMEVNTGETSFEDMFTNDCLHIVSFSDFQIDSLTSYFSGEIRLAYYYSKNRKKILTGGSISGSFSELAGSIILSKDKQELRNFVGPSAVKINGAVISS